MRAELQRSIFLACVGLLAGFALVVTLYGASTLFKRGLGSPTETGIPDGPAAPPSGTAPGEPAPRPREGAAPLPGKPLAARSGPGQDRPPAQDGTPPSFDIIRIEPDGEAVIAGRAGPNTTVELLRDTVPIARALVDPSGQFAIVPPALPTGSHEITLRVTEADGAVRLSRDSVAVVIAANRTAKPLIALTSPDKPTIVLSQPDSGAAGAGGGLATNMPAEAARAGPGARASRPAPGSSGSGQAGSGAPRPGTAPKPGASDAPIPVKIVSVEAEEGGRLYVTSQAQPGATVRLYLNDTLVAPGSTGADGRVAFTIGRGVRSGDYKIRVDQVDPVSGKVRTRSEVAFVVPAAVTKPAAKGTPDAASAPPKGAAPKVVGSKGQTSVAGAPATPAPERTAPGPETPDQPGAPSAADAPAPGSREAGGLALATPRPTPEARPAGPEGTRAVFVPEIGTARIARGDSLWQISRRIYGRGTRYTVIFDANQPQIRNPDLIYPGQIFVLPSEGSAAAPQDGTRG